MAADSENRQSEINALCDAAHWCYERAWVPATSGNFSVRDVASGRIFISPSGLNKGDMTAEHMLEVDEDGEPVASDRRPSAETVLHAVIYRLHPEATAIMHVHTVWNTLLSARFERRGHVSIEGYELLKGLSGVATHAHCEYVPILANTQNYAALSVNLDKALSTYPEAHGVLLSRHGLYTWGKSVADARRNLEALEFLFEVEERRLSSLV